MILFHGLDVSALNVTSIPLPAVSDHFLITFEASLACPCPPVTQMFFCFFLLFLCFYHNPHVKIAFCAT